MWATSTCPPRGALAGLTCYDTLQLCRPTLPLVGLEALPLFGSMTSTMLRWVYDEWNWFTVGEIFSQNAVDLLLPGVIYETWTMKTICFQLGHARCFDSLLKVMWLDSWTNEPRVAETVTCLRIFLKLKVEVMKKSLRAQQRFWGFHNQELSPI